MICIQCHPNRQINMEMRVWIYLRPRIECCCHWGELHETYSSLIDVINIQGFKELLILSHSSTYGRRTNRSAKSSKRALTFNACALWLGRKTRILYIRFPVNRFICLCRIRLRDCWTHTQNTFVFMKGWFRSAYRFCWTSDVRCAGE
jgi:hypothetical protein